MIEFGNLPAHAIETLVNVTTSLSTERDLNRLLDTILTAARSLTRSDGGRVYVLDNTKRFLLPEIQQHGEGATEFARNDPIPLFLDGPRGDERNDADVCAYCAFSGRVIRVDDPYAYSGFDFSHLYTDDRVLGERTRSLMVVPLRNHEDETIGVLQLTNMRDADSGDSVPFPEEIDSLVAAFASQAAVAINNVQLIAQNQHLIKVLDATNRELESENRKLRDKIEHQYRFANIVGTAKSMAQVFELMSKVLDTSATVLLGGETGTGKELIARAIHYNSRRKAKEFVAQNCAALPETLLESELFGFKAGAFSGAKADKKGLIELAHGGTLFLDEIGDMPLNLQAKLLRVLQEGEVRPLGALEARKVDVRVVAATHMDLQEKIRDGAFREDLYYRLAVFPIVLPPLRERKEDLPSLLQHFLDEASQRYGKEIAGIAPASVEALMRYDFPGNIRELRNVVERAVLMAEAGATLSPSHLAPEIAALLGKPGDPAQAGQGSPSLLPGGPIPADALGNGGLKSAVGSYEAAMIEGVLEQLDWNQTKAAAALKISRRTLIEKMQRYELRRGAKRAPS